jgi:orotidine-5'-phosphate decarboxylase
VHSRCHYISEDSDDVALVVPGIGAQPPYSNALSTVSVQQKHQNTNANLKKRNMKIKKHEKIQRQIYNRDRKREFIYSVTFGFLHSCQQTGYPFIDIWSPS